MNMLHDNMPCTSLNKEAFQIYNDSVNKSTSTQKGSIKKLKALYRNLPSDEIANYYAMALFNLSLRVSSEEMQRISAELERLFERNPTEDIAERIGRLKFNISKHSHCNNARTLKKYAITIEELYHKYPTNALAEPLAKIWYSILTTQSRDRLEYANKIIDLCQNIVDPDANTAYARVLFDPKISIENREKLMVDFLSHPQALDSLSVYVESPYYPKYNKLFGDFQLSSFFPTESIGKRMNQYFSKLKKSYEYDYIDLKVEFLALLHYAFEIRSLLIVPNIPVPIGHYTKIENLKYLVLPGDVGGKLRMSNACYMNDPSEGQTLIKALTNKDFSNLCEDHSHNIYLSCFTTAIDELPMWSMYGNDGKGCCLLFKRDFFDFSSEEFSDELTIEDQCSGENNFLFRVVYLSAGASKITIDTFPQDKKNLDQNVATAISNLQFHLNKIAHIQEKKRDKIINDILTFILGQIRYLFKDKSYAHEHELRLIRYSESPLLDNDTWVVPQLYVEVEKPLEYEQIILGPKVGEINRIIPYLTYTKKVSSVKKSGIKYR